jgi:hypothetical protein
VANEGFILTSGRPRSRRPTPRTSREYLQQKLDDRPETGLMQRAKLATKDERARNAINCMAYHEVQDQLRSGASLPDEAAARAKMELVAERVENKKARG